MQAKLVLGIACHNTALQARASGQTGCVCSWDRGKEPVETEEGGRLEGGWEGGKEGMGSRSSMMMMAMEGVL